MRVLWICNTILNEFTEEFHLRKKPFEGWIEGLWNELKTDKYLEIGMCFPIIDEWRMKNSVYNGYKYYSYHAIMDHGSYCRKYKKEFQYILKDFQPDVVHIWGTERNHSRAVVEACSDLGIDNRVAVRVQGIISACATYYTVGVPRKYYPLKSDGVTSIYDEVKKFRKIANNEYIIWSHAACICERSDWGEFYIKQINPHIWVEKFDNILRESFYKNCGKWNFLRCTKHIIFVSEAHYSIKGLHFLLKAAEILKKKYSDIEIRIAGNNLFDVKYGYGYKVFIKNLIDAYDLQNNVSYIGLLSADEMVQEYLNANVFVSSSVIENRANSICEAMMLGTPTIASYVGGNIGVIRHGVDGFYYPASDYSLLAGYIDRIFTDKELAKSISKEAVKSALQRHDKVRIKNIILKIYSQITERAGTNLIKSIWGEVK